MTTWATLPIESLASFATLTFLEIVLGVDNVIFLAVAIDHLPPERRALGRGLGLSMAMATRIGLLLCLVWLARIDIRVVAVLGRTLTVKDLVLLSGGLFLIAKGTQELHEAVESAPHEPGGSAPPPRWSSLAVVTVQIALIDIVFSIDSVITAVGMTSELPVMVAAIVAATLVMLFAAKSAGDFIRARPTAKVLALSFILLIGVALVADGLGFHIPRGYIYFAIAFSLFVEVMNGASARRRGGKPRL